MKRKSNLLTWLRHEIYRAARVQNDAELKQLFMKWHGAAKGAETEFDEMLRDAEMHGVRNPAFPDDMIGWLDDDFADRPQLLGYRYNDEKDKKDSEDSKKPDNEQPEDKDDDKKS